jgi:hypothetical protein
VRVTAAILAHVQFHITRLSPHCVIRCCTVSTAPQVMHRFVSVKLIAARRSLVGVSSWTTMYQCRLLGVRDPCCMKVLTIGTSSWYQDVCGGYASPHSSRLRCVLPEVHRISRSSFAQGFICARMRFIRHVESILADVDEFAWDSTHEGGFPLYRSGFMCVGKRLLRTFSARPKPIVYQVGAPDI